MASFSGRVKKFPGVGGFDFGHLNENTAGGERVAVNAQRGKFVDDEGLKSRRFEPRADELRVSRVEGGENSDEVHVQVWLEFKLQLVFTPARSSVNSNFLDSGGFHL